jgi:leucyl-tRNA synthetase
MLAPFAPHMAEELWERLGHATTLAYEPWPEANPEYLIDDEVTLAVQVNGKVRGSIRVGVHAAKDTVLELARAETNVARHLEGKVLRKEIYVPGKIVNLVVG